MRKIAFRSLLASALLATLLPPAQAGDRVTGQAFATRSEVIAQHGMIATSQPLATQIGLDILKAGGSAVDAAIAANAALGLMEPTGNGMGGDLFAIVWDPETQRLHGLNASGRSPFSLTLKELKSRGLESIPAHGPLPVSVPGLGVERTASCRRALQAAAISAVRIASKMLRGSVRVFIRGMRIRRECAPRCVNMGGRRESVQIIFRRKTRLRRSTTRSAGCQEPTLLQ